MKDRLLVPVLILSCLVAIASCAGTLDRGATHSASYLHPGALYTRSGLTLLAQLWAQDTPAPELEALMSDARRAVSRAPVPVADFRIPAYYREPDAHMAAKQALSDDARAAFALALASWIAAEPERSGFRDSACVILAAWAWRNRSVSGPDGDLVMCYAGLPLLLAADLIWEVPGWQGSEDRDRFARWVREVFLPSARRARGRANNHGDWGTAASIVSAYLLDRPAGVEAELEHLKRRIGRSIDSRGELPRENRRTTSGMWYTYFALAPMTVAAMVARNASGANLFDYVSPHGRSIRLALDRYWSYCRAPETWPYPRPEGLWGRIHTTLYPSAENVLIPTARDWPGDLFEVMGSVYRVEEWSSWVERARPLSGVRGWIYPSVLRLTLQGSR